MIPAKTVAMVQTAPRTLEMRDLPIPDIEDDSAILRIEACGICGSDFAPRSIVPEPVTRTGPVSKTMRSAVITPRRLWKWAT